MTLLDQSLAWRNKHEDRNTEDLILDNGTWLKLLHSKHKDECMGWQREMHLWSLSQLVAVFFCIMYVYGMLTESKNRQVNQNMCITCGILNYHHFESAHSMYSLPQNIQWGDFNKTYCSIHDLNVDLLFKYFTNPFFNIQGPC